MRQHPGYYTRQMVKLQKELHAKQSQLQAQLDLNDGLRWKERMLKGAIAAVAAGVKAVKPAPGQQLSGSSADPPPAQHLEVKPDPFTWQSNTVSNPAAVLLNSSGYCQKDTTDADAASSGSSTLDTTDAALESAIFSALDADSSTDIFFPDPRTAALNHLLSQVATTELKVQSTLLRLGCSELPGERLYTSQLLQQLLASGGQQRLQAAAEVSSEDWLLQLAAAVKQISCLLLRYDDDSSCHVSGWSARSQLDCLIDQQVQSAVARGLAGNPCAGLQHLAVNMETMSQQAYPEGWFARVAASLQLTADQRSILKAAWSTISIDRASLLARHEVLTKQLLEMQQQQALKQQDFGLRVQKAFERCFASMQKQAWHSMQALLVPGAAASAAAATAALGGGVQLAACQAAHTGGQSISSGSLNNATSSAPAGGVQFYRSSTPAPGCSGRGSSSSTARTASAAEAAASCTTMAAAMAGVAMCGGQLLQQQLGCIRAASSFTPSADSKLLSMTCDMQGPTIAANAAAADAFGLAFAPEVLMCQPRPGQQQLQQKLSGVRASLGLLYSWAGLVCYNTFSRKQLAVAAVTSYPFAFDPVAVCEAAAAQPPKRPTTAAATLRFA